MNKYIALIKLPDFQGKLEFTIRAAHWHEAYYLAEALAKNLKGHLHKVEDDEDSNV